MGGRHTFAAAALGQALAALIGGTAVASTSLARQGVSAPTLQSGLNYLLLGIVYTAVRLRTVGWKLKCRWWAYAVLALLDVEANFCVVLAYRYTSLTSVTLLDCFTIPMVVALSTALLGAAYRRAHYAGAGICIAGLMVLVTTDRGGGEAGAGASNPLLGDGLVLLGASLYALCNVLQEWLLADVPVAELLGTTGLFGCAWSALQGLPLELHTLWAAHWGPSTLLPFLGFALCMFCFYSLVPLELTWGGAALLNISLLASDLWAALARYFFFGGFQGNSLLFFAISLLVVAAGIGLFTWAGDVDTQLGAGSSVSNRGDEGPAGLPVLYQRVSTVADAGGHGRGPRLPLPSLSSGGKGLQLGREALEAVQRQQAAAGSAAGSAAGAAGAAGPPLSNPFDLAAPGIRTPSPAAGLPLPLAAREEGSAAAGAAAAAASPGAAAGTALQLSASPRFVMPGSRGAQEERAALEPGEER
ncbi:hypothetical protein ABPG75_011597 [Micractinium tetrahymenae]